MIRVRHPKDRKEYNRICKEWDSINEPQTIGPKHHWKGVLGAVIVIGCLGGLFYALSQVRRQNQEAYNDPMLPYMGGYGEEAVYNEDGESYSYTMEGNVGNHIYDYDSTYNGLEMSGFVSTIYNLLEKNVDYINTYNSCDPAEKEETLSDWKLMLDEYEQSLNDQVHHSSFEPAYQEIMDYITYSRELLETPEELHGEKLTKLDEMTTSVIDRICEGFDKNEIRYTRKDNGEVKFWYEKN